MRPRFLAAAVLVVPIFIACSSGSENIGTSPPATPPPPDGVHPVASGSVGPSGGTVESSGVKLVVPPGALTGDVVITIGTVDGPLPDDHDVLSPIFAFAPDGLTFAQPATVEIVAQASQGAVVLWSVPGGSGYEERPTTASATTLSASVTHFSRGLAGRRRPDAGPTDAGSDASDAAPDAPSDGGACVPYAGTCSPATTGPKCCNNVPCVMIVDDAGSHYMCLLSA